MVSAILPNFLREKQKQEKRLQEISRKKNVCKKQEKFTLKFWVNKAIFCPILGEQMTFLTYIYTI